MVLWAPLLEVFNDGVVDAVYLVLSKKWNQVLVDQNFVFFKNWLVVRGVLRFVQLLDRELSDIFELACDGHEVHAFSEACFLYQVKGFLFGFFKVVSVRACSLPLFIHLKATLPHLTSWALKEH